MSEGLNFFYIDANALVKRYHREKGTDQIDTLFDTLIERKPKRLISSIWSIPEVIATLNRKKNEGKIDSASLKNIIANLLNEVDMLDSITLDEERVLGSIPLIMEHNLNSADALHLSAIKEAKEIAEYIEGIVIVVTSDKRLLKAAEGEDFQTLNPEESEFSTINELIGS